ncbi:MULTISPECIES: hypothetical protein [Streptomyces]|uniref:hypothetical protein n=1 Tax=Streptomyces TaxID=1883 RepID=UPI0007CD4FA2|nr:hypothetical protein A4V12_33220 [Streptomyces noursei]
MTFRLNYGSDTEAVHDAMPLDASAQLSQALAAACDDRLAAAEPYGEDDGIVRTLTTERAIAVLLMGHQTKVVTVLQLSYTG